MKMMVSDGGGGTSVPLTPKPASDDSAKGGAKDAKDQPRSDASAQPKKAAPTKPAPAPAPTKVPLAGSSTKFSNKPVEPGGGSIADFVAAAKKAKSDAPADKPASASAPAISDTHDRERTANQSRYALRHGHHRGDLTNKIDDVQKQIDDLESKKSRGETIGTVAKVATSIAMPIAGLFGLGDKAKQGVEHLAGVDDAIKELKKQRADLEQQITLNGMSQMLYSQGAPLDVVDVLQDTKKVSVVPDKQLDGADAAYSMEDEKMYVGQSTVDNAKPIVEQLQKAGVMDAEGYIVDSRKAEQMAQGNDLLKLALLPSAHEETHASQAKTPTAAITDIAAAVTTAKAESAAAAAPTVAEADEIRTRAAIKNELRRIVNTEIPAYHNQELAHINLGAVQHNVMTVDENGHALPVEQSALNIYWHQEGIKFNEDLTPQLQAKAAETNGSDGDRDQSGAPGRRLFPATETDPGRRLFPGSATDPGRRLFPGTATDPGRRLFPGSELDPGRRLFPGSELDPGRRLFPGKADADSTASSSDAKDGAKATQLPPPVVSTAPAPQSLTNANAGTAPVSDAQLDAMVDQVLGAYADADVPVDAPGVFASGAVTGGENDPGRRLFPATETDPGRRLFPGTETDPGRRLFPGAAITAS